MKNHFPFGRRGKGRTVMVREHVPRCPFRGKQDVKNKLRKVKEI